MSNPATAIKGAREMVAVLTGNDDRLDAYHAFCGAMPEWDWGELAWTLTTLCDEVERLRAQAKKLRKRLQVARLSTGLLMRCCKPEAVVNALEAEGESP